MNRGSGSRGACIRATSGRLLGHHCGEPCKRLPSASVGQRIEGIQSPPEIVWLSPAALKGEAANPPRRRPFVARIIVALEEKAELEGVRQRHSRDVSRLRHGLE
jgi:hypothetical protein